MTHAVLVDRAVRWLRTTRKCSTGWKTKREARSRAKRLGWGRKLTDRGVVDLCPKHAKEEGL